MPHEFGGYREFRESGENKLETINRERMLKIENASYIVAWKTCEAWKSVNNALNRCGELKLPMLEKGVAESWNNLEDVDGISKAEEMYKEKHDGKDWYEAHNLPKPENKQHKPRN